MKDKDILIAGYGREGQSSHALLQRICHHCHIDIAHNNEEIQNALQNMSYDMIIKSPGIPIFVFEGLCDLRNITSQTDLFLQKYGSQTIGITGTKGKSTTSSLIFHVLKSKGKDVILAGNIGIPLFDIIPQIGKDTIVVAELSCHQLENIHRGPHIAVLLNLYQEHLDHYHDYCGYMMAKMQIVLKQQREDRFFYCSDNDDLRNLVESELGNIVSNVSSYSLEQAIGNDVLASADSPLKGEHNLLDSYVSLLVCREFGINDRQFVTSLESFNGLEHRLERVTTVNDITFYDDSISTIPQTAIAAIEALKDVETLILGGFDRGIDYAPLVNYLCSSPLGKAIKNIVLIGTSGKSIYDLLSDTDSRNLMCDFTTDYKMEDAVSFAMRHTTKGKICLLSPAASSYDHYKNFEERGNHFKNCVKQYC